MAKIIIALILDWITILFTGVGILGLLFAKNYGMAWLLFVPFIITFLNLLSLYDLMKEEEE